MKIKKMKYGKAVKITITVGNKLIACLYIVDKKIHIDSWLQF